MTCSTHLSLGAVIVAAGSGQRFGDPDKVFLPLRGRPVLNYALDLFGSIAVIQSIVVVLGAHTLDRGRELLDQIGDDRISACVGGDTRSDSVRAGIQALPHDIGLVAIHDAGRPLATREMTLEIIEVARYRGAAVPVVPVRDTTVRIGHDREIVHVEPREQLVSVQTPQVARRDWLESALSSSSMSTDEGSALFAAGYTVQTVEGSVENIKVTWPEDLAIADSILRRSHS